MKKRSSSQKGFTLIEMLVSISLFSMVLVIVLGAMLTIINVNRRAQALASVINNFNASVEAMNRVIKSAEPLSMSIGPGGESIELTVDNTNGLIGPEDLLGSNVIVTFEFDEANQRITRQLNSLAVLPITSEDVRIQKLQFVGLSPDQPEVVVIIAGEAGTTNDAKTTFEIMTTVSQRQSQVGP